MSAFYFVELKKKMRGKKAEGNKAVLAILMAMSVLASALVLPAYAANENVIVGITSESSISGAAPGDTATVPIVAYNVADIGACTITVAYNSAVCAVTDVTAGDLPTVLKNVSVAGLVRISAFDPAAGHTGDVTFANLKIKAIGSYGETSPLNISVEVLGTYGEHGSEGTEIPDANISVSNGAFTILRGPTPTPTPLVLPTEDADDKGTSDFVPTPTSTQTPTPYGLVAIFTIAAGLLVVAYLVLRRK